MQRISRLLSGPPSRRRWGAMAALGALTVSGVLALTQLGMAGGRLPDLMITASTDGPLGPGDYREISAADRQRFYRESVDAQGRRTEIYREAGQAKPIDAGVRGWIAEVSKPIVLPDPNDFPKIEDMAEFKTLVAQLAAQPGIIARLGSPVAMTSTPVSGSVQIGDAEGEADIRLELAGPKRKAMIALQADMRGRAWTLRRITME